jgi:2'-5' RNA ligase
VHHVIVPLDADHAHAVAQIAADLAAALAAPLETLACSSPHITLASYTGVETDRVAAALAPIAATTEPFTVRAHGYGVFAGEADADLSLHVMAVRTRELDELHRRVHAALDGAGACLAGNTHPSVWSPHVTVLDRGLTSRLVGRAVELLARRPHHTWSIDVDALAVAAGRGDPRPWPVWLRLGEAPATAGTRPPGPAVPRYDTPP